MTVPWHILVPKVSAGYNWGDPHVTGSYFMSLLILGCAVPPSSLIFVLHRGLVSLSPLLYWELQTSCRPASGSPSLHCFRWFNSSSSIYTFRLGFSSLASQFEAGMLISCLIPTINSASRRSPHTMSLSFSGINTPPLAGIRILK